MLSNEIKSVKPRKDIIEPRNDSRNENRDARTLRGPHALSSAQLSIILATGVADMMPNTAAAAPLRLAMVCGRLFLPQKVS